MLFSYFKSQYSQYTASLQANSRRSVQSPPDHFIITLIISDRRDWRDTRGKWPLGRNPDRSWWHSHTNWKFFWSQPMAPWTAEGPKSVIINKSIMIIILSCYQENQQHMGDYPIDHTSLLRWQDNRHPSSDLSFCYQKSAGKPWARWGSRITKNVIEILSNFNIDVYLNVSYTNTLHNCCFYGKCTLSKSLTTVLWSQLYLLCAAVNSPLIPWWFRFASVILSLLKLISIINREGGITLQVIQVNKQVKRNGIFIF